MYNLFAPSLFQKKACKLPGIGTLLLVTNEAETDFINTSIKAPYQEIVFIPSTSSEHVFNEFSAISELIKKKLDEEGKLELEGVGVFTKEANGLLNFNSFQLDADYTPTVIAERVSRQDATHNILVGDKETNNLLMTEFYNEETSVINDRWWIWAVVLAATAVTLFAFYFFQNGSASLGNAMPL